MPSGTFVKLIDHAKRCELYDCFHCRVECEAAGSRRPLNNLYTNQDDINQHQVIDIAVYKAISNGGLIIGTVP
jgi:hypothetical protein